MLENGQRVAISSDCQMCSMSAEGSLSTGDQCHRSEQSRGYLRKSDCHEEKKEEFRRFQVQYILCATELLDARLDDYAFLLVDSFPKRDETLRFDVINLTMLNLLKLRLPAEHFRPFAALTLEDINQQLECKSLSLWSVSSLSDSHLASINYQCERQPVSAEHLTHFRQHVLKRIEHFTEKKDRWLVVHQLLHHAYQNYIPLPYIYAIYDCLRAQDYEYRPHYMRPVLVKLQRIYSNDNAEMVNQTRQLLDYLQKNFSINYDDETIDLLIEYFFDQCHLAPLDIDTIFRKVNIRVNDYWMNLYLSTLKRLDGDLLNSLKVFLNVNRNFRFEYTPIVREQTIQAMQSLINRLSVNEENRSDDELFNHLKDLIDFIEVVNRRFVKNPTEVQTLNDHILASIVHWFSNKEQPRPSDFLERIVKLFQQRAKTIPVTDGTREKVYRQLGKDHSILRSLFTCSVGLQSIPAEKGQERPARSRSPTPVDNQSSMDDSGDIYIKATKNLRTMTIRELEDHLIELKRKKMNASGITSKLLTRYCTECLDGERTMTSPMREAFVKRIAELESIYFDKSQTTGFPSLGVIAILIDYCKRHSRSPTLVWFSLC